MNEVLKILKLVVRILIYPREMAISRKLTEYDVRTMSLLIVLMITFYLYSLYYFKSIPSSFLMMLIILLISIIFGIKYTIGFYRSLIISVVNFEIPYDMFKKIILPYVFTLQIIVLLVFFLNWSSNQIIYRLPIVWFHYQIFLIAKYRVYNEEMENDKSFEIAKKLFLVVIIFLSFNFFHRI